MILDGSGCHPIIQVLLRCSLVPTELGMAGHQVAEAKAVSKVLLKQELA